MPARPARPAAACWSSAPSTTPASSGSRERFAALRAGTPEHGPRLRPADQRARSRRASEASSTGARRRHAAGRRGPHRRRRAARRLLRRARRCSAPVPREHPLAQRGGVRPGARGHAVRRRGRRGRARQRHGVRPRRRRLDAGRRPRSMRVARQHARRPGLRQRLRRRRRHRAAVRRHRRSPATAARRASTPSTSSAPRGRWSSGTDSPGMPLRFTLRQLEYFVAVGECGSIAQAAERLNISSPSISAAVAQLESEFGLQLFVRRHAHGLSLTQAGRAFPRAARDLLAGRRASTTSPTTSPARCAGRSTSAASSPSRRSCCRGSAAASSTVTRRWSSASSSATRPRFSTRCASARLDVALTYDLDIPDDLDFLPLMDLPPFAVLSDGHPLGAA